MALPLEFGSLRLGSTQRPLSGSFLWFIFRILQGNPQKGLLRGLWVGFRVLLVLLLLKVSLQNPFARSIGYLKHADVVTLGSII